MKHRLPSGLAVVIGLAMAIGWGTASSALADDSATRLQLRIERLQQWLGFNERGDAWRRYLLLGQLESQAARGYAADPQLLAQSLERFSSGTAGLEHPVFAGVANAVRHHLELVRAAAGVDVSRALSEAQGRYVDITAADLDAARQRALTELSFLQTSLGSAVGGRDAIGAYRITEIIDFLGSFDFATTLTGEEAADRAALGPIVTRFNELAPYVSLAATQLDNKYVELAEFETVEFGRLLVSSTRRFATREDQRGPAVYAEILRRLPEELAHLSDSSQRQAAVTVGQLLDQLSQLNQAQVLVAAVRRTFSQPNLLVRIDERFVNSIAGRPIQEAQGVDEMILGNRVIGTAYTQGVGSVDFVPDPHLAHISIRMFGHTNTDGRTDRSFVTAFTQGNAAVEARRSFFVSPNGLIEFAPYTAVNLSSEFCGTNRCNLIDRFAAREFERQQYAAEAVGAYKAEQRVYQQFTQQTNQAIWEGRQQIARSRQQGTSFFRSVNQFRRDFIVAGTETSDTPPDRRPTATEVLARFAHPGVSLSTSDSHLYLSANVALSDQLAAPSMPPTNVLPTDVSAQIHESLVSNFISPVVADRTLYSYEFSRKAEALMSEVPAGLVFDSSGDDVWSITFAPVRPIQVEFDDQRIRVTVAGRQFTRRNERYREAMLITSTFRVVQVGSQLKLMRDGQTQVAFATPGTKSASEIAFQTFLQDQLNASMSGDPAAEAVDLPANLLPLDRLPAGSNAERLRDAELVQLRAEGGWLTLGWRYRPGSAGAPDPTLPVDTPAISN